MTERILLSLGSINADYQVRTPSALRAGQTIMADHFTRLGGGKAANRAFLAHKLGHPTRLLARVGRDDLQAQALDPLRRVGIDVSGVGTTDTAATAVSMIAVPPDGKKSIILAGNANESWDEAAIADAVNAVKTSPHGWVLSFHCEIKPKALMRCVTAARECGLRSVLDPAPAERVACDLLGICHAIAPDAQEAAELTEANTDTPEGAANAARKLAASGPTLVCASGPHGRDVGRAAASQSGTARPGEALQLKPSPPPALGPVRMRLQHRNEFLSLHWDGVALRLQADGSNAAPVMVLHDDKRSPLGPGGEIVLRPD